MGSSKRSLTLGHWVYIDTMNEVLIVVRHSFISPLFFLWCFILFSRDPDWLLDTLLCDAVFWQNAIIYDYVSLITLFPQKIDIISNKFDLLVRFHGLDTPLSSHDAQCPFNKLNGVTPERISAIVRFQPTT